IHSRDSNVTFQVWEIERQEAVVKAPGGVHHYAVDFSPDSGRVAAGRPDGSVALYTLPDGKVEKLLDRGPPPHSLAFHLRGKKLAVSTLSASQVQVRDVETGRTLATLPHAAAVRGMAWSADGQLFATAC